MSFVAVLTFAVVAAAQAPQDPVWIAARPVAVQGLAEARIVAAAGPWFAFVRVLPVPPAMRRYHAPRHPWELLRVGPGGAPEVIAGAGAGHTGWGPPSIVAVARDGSVAATWRPGHRVLYAPPGGAAVEHGVDGESDRDCVALTTAWIVHVDRRSRALTVRTLEANGIGEAVELDGDGPEAPERAVCGAHWVGWVAGADVVTVDLDRRLRRTVATAARDGLELDGIWNGHLLAHENGETPRVHVVELASGAARSLPAPPAVRACTPEGVFGDGWIWDPVADRVRRFAPLSRWNPGSFLRRAPGVLWLRDRRERAWQELCLADAPVAVPADAPRVPAPEAPAQPDGTAGDAARAAWRAARGR